MSKEQDYFNCEEDYEHDYVASLFEETQQVMIASCPQKLQAWGAVHTCNIPHTMP